MSGSKRDYYMAKGRQLQQLETEAATPSGGAGKTAQQVTKALAFDEGEGS